MRPITYLRAARQLAERADAHATKAMTYANVYTIRDAARARRLREHATTLKLRNLTNSRG